MVILLKVLLLCMAFFSFNEPSFAKEDRQKAIKAFLEKIPLNPYKTIDNAYKAQIVAYDPSLVCAIKYQNDGVHYRLQTFASRKEALDAGYILTHLGGCGSCSTLQDLAVYLQHSDLTSMVRGCGVRPFAQKRCLEKIGFSSECGKIWRQNIAHTAKKCLFVCLRHYGDPYNEEDGSLNPCLSCDEKYSGPVFKAVAGRTRRNSGIESAILRRGEEVADVVHDYY